MNRTIAVSLCILLLAGCSAGKGQLSELQKSNEDLTRRVKALEDQLLETDKKIIQHEQALKQMYERVRATETMVDKISLGPAPVR